MRDNLRDFFRGDGLLFLNGIRVRHPGKQAQLQNAELQAGFILDFLLERGRKFGKTLVRHDVQQIDILVVNALAVLVHAQTQAAPDFLTTGEDGFLLNQRADLKNVGVVPSLFQSRMRENETQRAVKRQQPFLVFHDGVVGAGVVLGIASGVLVVALFVLRKIAVMHFFNRITEPLLKLGVLRQIQKFVVTLLEHFRIRPFSAFRGAVFFNLVDKEQGKYLDALFRKAQFLVKMGLNSAANLRPLDDVLINAADGPA